MEDLENIALALEFIRCSPGGSYPKLRFLQFGFPGKAEPSPPSYVIRPNTEPRETASARSVTRLRESAMPPPAQRGASANFA